MKQFDDTQQSQYYGNYREVFLVIGSFLVMVLYLRIPLSEQDVGKWMLTTALTATAIINLALYLVPMPQRSVFIPLYPYAKANAFSSLMWLIVSLAVGWRSVFVFDWQGVGLTIACVVVGFLMIVVGTFVHLFLRTFAMNNMILEDYRNEHNGNVEKYWQGHLPDRVDNYVKPRYVYADGDESETPRPEGGQVIGYRISPTLVIHSATCSQNYSDEFLLAFVAKFGGKLLTADDVKVLKKNWNVVSKMRTDIGEAPLPLPFFWYAGTSHLESTHYRENFIESDPQSSAVIMKR
ncbi:MAG: hypothetical protein J6N49_00095 [Alphaproteobacteria bacterium]|nr:hypothetical protein [Alphaproteobacteria bacterium]